MLQGFTGQFPQKVDGKGRMSVPAPFRRVLEANDPNWTNELGVKMYVNYGKHLKQNLRVYSVKAMQRIAARIDTLPEGSKLWIQLNRLYLGQSDEVTMDRDGRIVLPQRLREKLGVAESAELTLMGIGQYFEIWEQDMFDNTVDPEQDEFLEDLGEGVDPLSLIPAAPPVM